MEVDQAIAFIFGGLVMVWAFRSAAFAFGGGETAGMHEVAPPAEEETGPSEAEVEAKYQRTHRMHQGLLYLAGIVVTAAIVGMLVGSLLA